MTSIALVMIVRDEARCIERCLASAKPWVDQMVVLDTGSHDDTVSRAKRAGAAVSSFDWIDDFSAARNAALSLTNADWALVLDADEWIVAGTEALSELRHAGPSFIGLVTVNNLFGDGLANASQSPSWIPRVLPRGVAYAGRIHEQPVSNLARRRLPLVILHDGYLHEPMQAKRGRNDKLLRMALAEQPNDAYLSYQLGKDLELKGEFEAALAHYRAAAAGVAEAASWRHDLVLRWLYTLKMCQQFHDAMNLAQAEMPRWTGSPDFYFTLGDLLLDWAAVDPQRGTDLLPMIESSWLRAVEIGERPDLPDTVRGRGSYLAAHNLAVMYDGLNQTDKAALWRQREHSMRLALSAPAG